MKFGKIMKKIVVFILACVLAASILNIRVTTRRGIDFKVCEIKIPLYLKALDYLDRHFNYKELAGTITFGAKDEDERVLRILDWVHTNIRQTPQSFPVIDDHPLNIITRGYGVKDQFEDIFTILCYYAGTRAFFANIKNSSGKYFQISFVKLRRGWSPMSAYSGVCVKKERHLATVKDIMSDHSIIRPFADSVENFEEKPFLSVLNNLDSDTYSMHTAFQSPLGRLKYCISRVLVPAKKLNIKKED